MKVITFSEITDYIEKNNTGIVLTGGCFDILHVGHTRFLEKSKSFGKTLVVLLESDERIKQMKGEGRPINGQDDRAEVLASLKSVDVIIKLPPGATDYAKIVKLIRPSVITITDGDKIIDIKRQQADSVGAKLEIVEFVPNRSTTRIIELLL